MKKRQQPKQKSDHKKKKFDVKNSEKLSQKS